VKNSSVGYVFVAPSAVMMTLNVVLTETIKIQQCAKNAEKFARFTTCAMHESAAHCRAYYAKLEESRRISKRYWKLKRAMDAKDDFLGF